MPLKTIGGPIAAAWDGYDQQVLQADAPQSVRDECRLAFFAGAAVVLAELNRVDDDDEIGAMQLLDLINDELRDFGQQLDAEWMKRLPRGRMM